MYTLPRSKLMVGLLFCLAVLPASAFGFRGGVRVATGDFNSDGVPDLVAAPGPGGGPHIKLIDGATGVTITEFFAYESRFTGGVFVAVGDLTGDGVLEIVTGADSGGGPHVKIFELRNGAFAERNGFFAFDAAFTGGVRVAVANVDGEPGAEIIVGAGPGGGPHVRVFNANGTQIASPVGSFFAYDQAFRGGVFVAAGDLTGDGRAEIVTGAGASGGPHVKVFEMRNGAFAERSGFFAYDRNFTGGVRVAVGNVDGASGEEIITGAGPGGGPHVQVFLPTGQHLPGFNSSFFAYDQGFRGGIFVAAGRAGDGRAKIGTGADAGGGPHVKIFEPRNGTIAERTSLFAYPFSPEPTPVPVGEGGNPRPPQGPWNGPGEGPTNPPSNPGGPGEGGQPARPPGGGQCNSCTICERQIYPRPPLCLPSPILSRCLEASSALSQARGTTVFWPAGCTPPPISCSGCVICTDRYPAYPQFACSSYYSLGQCNHWVSQGFRISRYLPDGCR